MGEHVAALAASIFVMAVSIVVSAVVRGGKHGDLRSELGRLEDLKAKREAERERVKEENQLLAQINALRAELGIFSSESSMTHVISE